MELVNESLKMQEELLQAYPDLPKMEKSQFRTFNDYSYAAHDQATFLYEALNEIKNMHESHFMTKKNKELMREKKALIEELDLAKSVGPSGADEDMVNGMRDQLQASQKAHQVTT